MMMYTRIFEVVRVIMINQLMVSTLHFSHVHVHCTEKHSDPQAHRILIGKNECKFLDFYFSAHSLWLLNGTK